MRKIKMNNKFAFFFVFLVLFTVLFIQSTFALTPSEILEKVDQYRAPGNTFVFNVKLTIKKPDENTVSEFIVRVKNATKSLVRYTYPPSIKGRILLMVEDNMWIYVPKTRNPIRISPQQQLMGGVSNADVARVVYSLDYDAISAEKEILDQTEVLKLALSGKTKGAAYKSITLWVNVDTYQPIKAEFYALSGRKLKTVFYKNYQNILGQSRATTLEILDAVNQSEVSLLEYKDFKLEDTPETYYQKSYLEHISNE